MACGEESPPPVDDLLQLDAGTDAEMDSGELDTTADLSDGGAFGWPELAARYGTLTTVAGLGDLGTSGLNGWVSSFEGGSALGAELSRPHIALADPEGNLFIADKDGHGVRRVATDGTIRTIAGLSEPGDDGDAPGPADARHLSSPNGIWLLPAGKLAIYDLGNDKVRMVAADGTLTTLFAVGGSGTGRGLWVADDESVAYVAAGTALKEWTREGGVVPP
jgi:hypothetical protein